MKHIVFITNPISGTISKAGIPELVEVHLDHARFSYEFVSTQYAAFGSFCTFLVIVPLLFGVAEATSLLLGCKDTKKLP